MSDAPGIPTLEGAAADAVAHRGGHIQIIAAAGSGKTEVVSQRIAALLADGVVPESIVAFTFTEKAAVELKKRIRLRAEAKLGTDVADTLGKLFVGTTVAHISSDRVIPRISSPDVAEHNAQNVFESLPGSHHE